MLNVVFRIHGFIRDGRVVLEQGRHAERPH